MASPITTHVYLNTEEFFQNELNRTLRGIQLNKDAIYHQTNWEFNDTSEWGSLTNQMLVHHHIFLKFQGIEYQAETGLIQFIPDGQLPTSKSTCYELLNHEFFFNDPAYGGSGQRYRAFIHPHHFMSLLFVGTDMDQQKSLFLELNELGEIVAYYCTQSDYDASRCANKVELFATNVFMGQAIAEIAFQARNPSSAQIGYLIKESLDEVDYETRNKGLLKRHDPVAVSPIKKDIIPALQCIGSHFAIQNLFSVNIFPILHQIYLHADTFIQTALMSGSTRGEAFPVHSHYMSKYYYDQDVMTMNPGIDPFLCHILGIYRQYGNRELYAQLKTVFERMDAGHLQYIESVKRGLGESYIHTDVSIFNETPVPVDTTSEKYDRFRRSNYPVTAVDLIIRTDRPLGDPQLIHPSLQNAVVFEIWNIMNNGYIPGQGLKAVIQRMSEDYGFEVFNVVSLFIDDMFKDVNAPSRIQNVQQGARLEDAQYATQTVEL